MTGKRRVLKNPQALRTTVKQLQTNEIFITPGRYDVSLPLGQTTNRSCTASTPRDRLYRAYTFVRFTHILLDRQQCPPPERAARLLALVLPKEERAGLLGDLEEECRRHAIKHGRAFARRWYWAQTIRTIVAYSFDTLMSAAERVVKLWRPG